MSVPSTDIFRPDIFKGKVLFCTGGGTGICNGIVRSVMKHGANAAIFGRRANVVQEASKKLEADTGSKCIGVSGDVRKLDTLEAAVQKTIETYGRIDFVIAGAAGNFLAPITSLSTNAFRAVLEIDTLGTFNTLKATVEELKKTKGAFLAVSATLHYHALGFQAHASAAKAAVDKLINVAALEFGPFGIRANTIAPGAIEGTEGIDRLLPKEIIEERKAAIPLQRFGTIDDIANATVFLFSDAANYISASQIVVDAGSWQHEPITPGYPDVFKL